MNKKETAVLFYYFIVLFGERRLKMRKKGLGFICIGYDDKFYFLNKDTGKIISANNISRAEYLPNRIIRLKKRFPLKQITREALIAKIRDNYKSSTRKT